VANNRRMSKRASRTLCKMAADLSVGQEFVTFEEAESNIVKFCRNNYHAVRVDNKVKVKSANTKLSEKSRVTDLPDDQVFACR